MDEKRKEFCREELAELENRIRTALSSIGQMSSPAEDRDAAAAVKALVETRAILLVELEAY